MRKHTGPGKAERRTNPLSLMLYNFDVEGAELKKEHEAFLNAEAVPTLQKGGSVTLIGLTDRTGSRAYNQKLSEARVAGTIAFLNKKVPSGFGIRNDTAGYGEQAAEREGERDGTEDERFRTVLLFLSETPIPPNPEFPETHTYDPLRLAKAAYGKWIQFKRAFLILPGTKEPTSLRLLNAAEAHQV